MKQKLDPLIAGYLAIELVCMERRGFMARQRRSVCARWWERNW